LSYAGSIIPVVPPCAGGDGANLAGCTIGTTDTTYTLTGDIQPAPGVKGIEFQSGATGNATTLTGNITTSGANADGLYLLSSDDNATTLTGDIIVFPFYNSDLFIISSIFSIIKSPTNLDAVKDR